MRIIFYYALLLLVSACQGHAIATGTCSAGTPVTQFRLMLVPERGRPPLPINSVNEVLRGEKLKYEPPTTDQKSAPRGKITVILVPASGGPSSKIEVLDPKPADAVQEWNVPARASIVGVVYGPHGLDVKKFNSLVAHNQNLIPQLADYAEKAATVEALVQTISKYEQSPPASGDLDAVLKGFSSQYGVSLPSINSTAPADQQASQLLHAVVPVVSSYDPLAERKSSAALQQSAGVAAWVAALFWGSTPVGLAAGGASLLQNMRTLMFPDTDFRAAFAQTTSSKNLELCTTQKEAAKRMRTAYLWVRRVPNAGPPAATLPAAAHVPLDWKSEVRVTCATRVQLRDLPRAREWRLVSDDHHSSVPVDVTVGSDADTLTLDLTKAKLAPGKYKLAALWDWTPFDIGGALELHKFADLSTAKVEQESEDNLVHGSGTVAVKLTGPDFEFVDKLALVRAGSQNATAKVLSFTLEKGKQEGEQNALQTEVDTSSLDAGRYLLMLTQLNGAIQDVPLTIHPSNPKLLDLPLRANLGEKTQTLMLQGSGLDRITRITSDGAEWTLAPDPKVDGEIKERKVTLHLAPKAHEDELLSASLYVEGISKPLTVAGIVHVVGPRPRITDVRISFPKESYISLEQNEIPAGSVVSFAIEAQHMGPSPVLALGCNNDSDTRQTLTLHPGDRNGPAQLDFAGSDALFLSVEPGAVGQSGCQLAATVTDGTTGSSDPYALGRVTRLPQITRFTLSDQKVEDSLYAGTLTGQDLQMIEKTGWGPDTGYPVQGIPTPVPGSTQSQTLKVEMSWPPPSPHAPIYIWLRGENTGRLTDVQY